jgi:hypothetical protein
MVSSQSRRVRKAAAGAKRKAPSAAACLACYLHCPTQHVPTDPAHLLPPAGDGWSPRAEDAILHGCIPVIIMDEVHAVYESILDWDGFSLRINQDSVQYLPQVGASHLSLGTPSAAPC